MTTPNDSPEPRGPDTCARCGTAFGCGMLAGEKKCWCMDMPVLDPLPKEYEGCLCPACLATLVANVPLNRQGAKIAKDAKKN